MDKRNRKLAIGQQLPDLGLGREAQVQRAIAMEMQAIAREIYVRSVMVEKMDQADFELIARRCHLAARAYFIGVGVIQADNPVDSSTSPDA